MGVGQELTLLIENLVRRSRAYCDCERKKPLELLVIYIPRKKFNGPRSLRANDVCGFRVNSDSNLVLFAVRIISSTYIKMNKTLEAEIK